MKAHTTAKSELSRHHVVMAGVSKRHEPQVMAVADNRSEIGQQGGLLTLMASSPRLQRQCACGSPSALGGSCSACEQKLSGPGATPLLRQVAIGATDDPLEREADRVAEQVMRMELPDQPLKDRGMLRIQRLESHSSRGASEAAPPSVERVLAGSGRPLEPWLREEMEQRFMHDFSSVRIHNDAEAQRSARCVNAHAYTVGDRIVFGAGRFAPQTREGQRLLAHELTHVIQQGGLDNPRQHQAESNVTASTVDGGAPRLSAAHRSLQRQPCDPLTDPFCEANKEGKKDEKKMDPKTARVYEACPDTCKTFPPVEIAPGAFLTLCSDEITSGSARITMSGCTPGRLGRVTLFSGAPAWQLPMSADKTCAAYSYCTPYEQGKQKPPDTSKIQIGYIQTIENAMSGGVYFKRDAAQKWAMVGNSWECLKNVRDGEAGSQEPWYGKASGNAGPQPYTGCPLMSDTPWVSLPSGQNIKCVDNLYDRPEWQLRRMSIEGVFHIWLVAKAGNSAPVFIHNWTIKLSVVFDLKDDADPCNKTGWVKTSDEKTMVSKGPGLGSAKPVLTGNVPAEMEKKDKDCSTPPSSDLQDKPCAKLNAEQSKPEKK